MTSYYIDNTGLYSSDGRTLLNPKGTALLDWMLSDNPKENKLLYDLDACVASIIKLCLNEAQVRELYEKEKIWINGFKITYFPTRFFAIDKNKIFTNYGAMTRYKSDVHYAPNDTVEDKIAKAKEADAIATSARNILKELGLDSQRIISPVAAVVDKYVWSLRPPTIDDMPEEVGELAYQTIQGNHLEAYQMGYWKEAWDYDINCYSQDTEVLTKDGWKLITCLTLGEQIMTFNPDIERCRFQPITALHINPYKGKMITINSRKVNLCVTPNHHVLVQNHIRSKKTKAYKVVGHHHYGQWQTYEAKDLPNGNFRLPISFPLEDKPDYPIENAMLEIIAWINTEGHLLHNKGYPPTGICISQSEATANNIRYCKEIEECLKQLKLSYSHRIEYEDYSHEYPLIANRIFAQKQETHTIHRFRIKAKSFRQLPIDNDNLHFIPMWVLKQCSLRQLTLFFNTLMKGDGCRQYNNTNNIITAGFFTNLAENKDRFMYLCHLLGHKVSFRPPDKHHSTFQIRINEGNRKEAELNNHKTDITYGECLNEIDYDGIIACPTVEDGYIVIRREGKSCICGNSAYGSQLAKLLDIRRGTWIQDTTMPKEAVYGFAEGILNVTAPFHPFIVKASEEYTYTPIGSRIDQLTKEQIDLLHKHNLGTFQIQRGYWWIPSETKPRYEPLRGIITHLHKIRSESDGLKKAILRQMIAGIWGRMVEIRKSGLGKLFNPVWGSLVENNIKCQVCDTCLSAGIMPLLVAVDGVITDKPLPVQDSLAMGGWRLSHKGKCIIASSGVVGFEGKEGAEEFALKFEWLYDQLKQHPEQSEYTMTKYSPMTLAKAIQSNNFDKLGELKDSNRTIIIGKDYKRLWKSYPKNGGELMANRYESNPIDAVMAKGL